MQDKYKFSRTSVLDKTTSIDEANMQKVNDISELAREQLKRFDQQLQNSQDPASYYEKMREEMISSTEIPTEKPANKNGVYELEIVDTQLLPTISQKQEVDQPTAKINLNLRGKLIIAVYASIILLLSVLLIYNAVSIASYNTQIATTSQELVIREQELEALQSELQILIEGTTPEGVDMSQNGGISLKPKTFNKNTVVKNEQESNWFDDLCNFFSSIFGG